MSETLGCSSRAGRNRVVIALTCLSLSLFNAAIAHGQSRPQGSAENRGTGYTSAIAYGGSIDDALAAVSSGQTIPMTSHSFTATKDGSAYTDVFVGASPFAATKGTTTINFLILPVIVVIGSTTFDPTVPDSCINGGLSPLKAFQESPILSKVVFDGGAENGHGATMNGVNVGTTTYPDAFRRAEYWKEVSDTNYHTLFKVTVAPPWTISASEVASLGGGNVLTSLCADLGVLNEPNFQSYIQNTVIPSIPAITPTTFALFLMKDVVTTNSSALNCLNGCLIGYHGAFGSPVQTYAVSEYDTTQKFWNDPGFKNISILAHEVGEWMEDPLVTNPTPPWGGIGQQFNCQTNWEIGDPLTGTDFPAIKMPNGINYDPQELVFWSWYYNAEHTASIGAGGKFSDNRSFAGPSKACPPGGTN
jgi:hypothetical protein